MKNYPVSHFYDINFFSQKFDVVLNHEHRLLEDFDIYDTVGHATAYDEAIPLFIDDNGKQITFVNGEVSQLRSNTIPLTFLKVKKVKN